MTFKENSRGLRRKIFLVSGWWVVHRALLIPRFSRVVVLFDVFCFASSERKKLSENNLLRKFYLFVPFSVSLALDTQHERVTQQMKLRKRKPNRMHSNTSARRVAECGAGRPLFYLFNFSFSTLAHLHSFLTTLFHASSLSSNRQAGILKGVTYVRYRNRFRLRGWCSAHMNSSTRICLPYFIPYDSISYSIEK